MARRHTEAGTDELCPHVSKGLAFEVIADVPLVLGRHPPSSRTRGHEPALSTASLACAVAMDGDLLLVSLFTRLQWPGPGRPSPRMSHDPST